MVDGASWSSSVFSSVFCSVLALGQYKSRKVVENYNRDSTQVEAKHLLVGR
jgi:hypothetical protein